MSVITSILLFIVVIFIVVVFHELGHFCAGILTKTKIFEFNIGMGPKVISKRKKDIDYNLRAFPIGGSVNFGSQYDSVDENEFSTELKKDDKNAIYNKSILQRIFIFASGPLMNFVLAILIFIGLFGYYGVPSLAVSEVTVDSPAAAAGFESGDVLIAVNGTKVSDVDGFIAIVGEGSGITHTVLIERDGKQHNLQVTPLYNEEEGRALIGISLGSMFVKKSFWSTVTGSVKYTFNQIKGTLVAIGDMFKGKEKVDLSGPVGIAQISGQAAKQGFGTFLSLIAAISISLGLVNLFPIPILDGGWILLLIVEGIRRKPLSQNVEIGLKFAGLLLILGIFIYATYGDIVRIVSGGA